MKRNLPRLVVLVLFIVNLIDTLLGDVDFGDL